MGELQSKYRIPARLTSPLWIVLLKIILDVLYTTVIQPAFAYYGFKNDFSSFRYFISWVMLILIFVFVNRWGKKEQVSYKISIVLLFFGYLPAATIYTYMNAPFLAYLLLYYVLLMIAVDRIGSIRIKTNGIGRNGRNQILFVFVIVLMLNELVIWAVYAHFNIQLDLYNVYDVRNEARSYSLPTIMTYLHSWARTITPFLALYYLHNKKKIMFAMLVVMQFITFSIDASKSVFFSMLLSIALYFLLKKGQSFIHYIPFGLSVLSVIAYLEKTIIGTTFITNYFIRRMMFFPALLNYQYYEYFTNNGFDYYRRSIGGVFSESTYNMDLADIIGQSYYGHAMHANNGLFADAYSNLGIVGVIIMPIALALVLKILDGSTKYISPLVAQALIVVYGFSLTSSSFFTILLTHGLGLVCILGYFVRDEVIEGNDESIKTNSQTTLNRPYPRGGYIQ